VRPLPEYNCQVWSPCYVSLIRQVESVQKNYKKIKGVFHVTLLRATKQTGSQNTGNEAIEARFGNVLQYITWFCRH